MCQRCPAPACQDEIPPMCGPLSPSASEEIPPRVVRSDRPACDALAFFRQDAAATARPALPSQEEVHHTDLSDTIVKTLIVCFRRCGISLLSHIHINMFDAFVKKVIILHCSCGMALILHIHINLFQTFAIPTRRCTFYPEAETPRSHRQGATRKYKRKTENMYKDPSS